MKEKTGEILLEEYLVAHLDFLGAKNLIFESEKIFISNLLKAIDKAKELVQRYQRKTYNRITYNFRIFSDNICIYIKCAKSSGDTTGNLRAYNEMLAIIRFVMSFQYTCFVNFGLFMRGGIAKGSLFINEDLIIGKALVEAHYLESKKADYPRILISNSICEFMKANNDYESFFRSSIRKDYDGHHMASYLEICMDEGYPIKVQLLLHKENLIIRLKNASNIKIKNKILSLIKYHNTFCSELKPSFPEALIEPPH